VASKVRDPERAVANRLGRDEELVRRLRTSAAALGLPVIEVSDLTETLQAIQRHFQPLLVDWIDGPHGDVSARRRDENDARLRQWRFFMDSLGTEPTGEIDLACECDRPGCELLVLSGLPEAEAARERDELLLSSDH